MCGQSYSIRHNMPFIDTLLLAFLVHQKTMRYTYQGTYPLRHDRLLRVVTTRYQILLGKIPTHLRIFPPQCPRRMHPTWYPNLRLASHTICRQFDLIRESVVDMGILYQQAIHHLCLVLSSNLVLV